MERALHTYNNIRVRIGRNSFFYGIETAKIHSSFREQQEVPSLKFLLFVMQFSAILIIRMEIGVHNRFLAPKSLFSNGEILNVFNPVAARFVYFIPGLTTFLFAVFYELHQGETGAKQNRWLKPFITPPQDYFLGTGSPVQVKNEDSKKRTAFQ